MEGQYIIRTRLHQTRSPLSRFPQPQWPVFGFQNQRHPVMDRAEIFVGCRRDNCAGALTVFIRPPILPDPCKCNRFLILTMNIPWQARSLFRLGPFKKPCRDDQTAARPAGVTKSGFFRQSLGPRVDQQRPSRFRFVPVRQKSPTQRVQMTACLAAAHHMYLICRTNIEVWNGR